MHRHAEGRYGAQLQIGNTDACLMQWIHQRFGGSLSLEHRKNPKHQPVWRWTAAARDLDVLIQSVLPYLITKKAQAELFLAFRRTLNSVARVSHSTARKSEAARAEGARIHARLVALKKPHLADKASA